MSPRGYDSFSGMVHSFTCISTCTVAPWAVAVKGRGRAVQPQSVVVVLPVLPEGWVVMLSR